MTCTGCTAKFGLFRKEKSCRICKLSFCPKCLNVQRQILPQSSPSSDDDAEIFSATTKAAANDGQRLLICKNCATRLSKKSNSKTIDAEDNLTDNFSNGNDLSGIRTVSKSAPESNSNKTDRHHADNVDDLYKRLETLKNADRKDAHATIREEDISKRLHALKGENAPTSSTDHSWLLRPKPRKTQAEETDDLLNEYQAERNISSKILTPEQDIAQRLAKLRGEKKQDEPQIQQNDTSAAATAEDLHPEHTSQPATNTFSGGDPDPDWDEIDRLMRTTYDQCRKDAQIALKDEQVKKMLKNPKLADLKAKHPDKQRAQPDDGESSSEEGESEIDKVLNEVLSSKDEEDEILDM